MRTSVRAATLAVLAVGLSVLFVGAGPAQAAAVFVEANPSTARPGDQITLRASCPENITAGTVTGSPFGTVTVQPQYGFLTAAVRVPTTTKVGDYTLTLFCPDKTTKTTGVLHVVALVEPTRGPATGGGGTAPGRSAPMLIGGGLTAIVVGAVLAVASILRRRRLG
jgi:hypothetical protein